MNQKDNNILNEDSIRISDVDDKQKDLLESNKYSWNNGEFISFSTKGG